MLQIQLHPQLTPDHLEAIARYLTQSGQLTAREWVVALRAFDLLGGSSIRTDKRRENFSAIYKRLIEQKRAAIFLERLLTLTGNVEAEGERLKAAAARVIVQELSDAGLYRRDIPETRYLLAYCYYWWNAFARGYIFEVLIYRDLARAGVEFTAHDILDPTDRMSRSDLIVLGREGDIKTSTYFLVAARTQVLRHDFYIAQLYNEHLHRNRIVVILSQAAWRDIDGFTVPARLDTASGLLPKAVRVKLSGSDWVVVDYDTWKARVRLRQQEKSNETETI